MVISSKNENYILKTIYLLHGLLVLARYGLHGRDPLSVQRDQLRPQLVQQPPHLALPARNTEYIKFSHFSLFFGFD
jgi:hypothetical protein